MPDSPRSIVLTVNGTPISVAPGTTVAAAVLLADQPTRKSISGELRGPLCGMGICFECRVTIDGIPHQRSCQLLCTPGIRVTSTEDSRGPGTP